MNFIKIMLFALLASILFFVYLEVEKTNNSVMVSSFGKSKNEHVIYREGKRVVVSNEAYAKLRAIQAPKIKIHTPLKTTSEIKTLKLSGNIPDGVSYKISVLAESKSTGLVCGKLTFSLGLWGGKSGFYRTNTTRIFRYTPTIKDGHHEIEIPIKKLLNATIGCEYSLDSIYIEILNEKFEKRWQSYGGSHTLFFPKETYSRHVYSGDPYNHSVGSTLLNIECISKDLNDKITYFNPTCHLKSTVDSVLPAQSLNYNNYQLNITTTTQNEFELQRFKRSKAYRRCVFFIHRIAHFLKFYNHDLNYFMEKRERLGELEARIAKALEESKVKIVKILENLNSDKYGKERLSEESIRLLKNKLKIIEKSMKANMKIQEMEKELFFSKENLEELDAFNAKFKLDKLFLDNAYYKYQMLHFVKQFAKRMELDNQFYKLHREERDVSNYFSKTLFYSKPSLNCEKYYAQSEDAFCSDLMHLSSEEKEVETKKMMREVSVLRSILLLKDATRNISYAIKLMDEPAK